MKPWKLIDQVPTPDGKTISLHDQDGSYTIHVDGRLLMSTRQHTSEERLAELACAHLRAVPGARVLIGGLGFGFTLRAALAALAPDAAIVVAEIFAAVIAWNRNGGFPLAADAMADPRVTVLHRDVAEVIREARAEFDSILFDVDNGPAALSSLANQRLYDYAGLRRTRAALRPGGCAAFWSATPNPEFAKLMVRAGFTMDVQHCRAHGKSGARHTIFRGRVS